MRQPDNIPNHSLQIGEVHAWVLNLGKLDLGATGWELSLSGEEIERAERYRFFRDRLHFLQRRSVLRQLLGFYCELEPAEITYDVNPYGKLSIQGQELRFSLSHSQDWVALAFTPGAEIGVDIEAARPLPDQARLAEHWFSPEEKACLAHLPPGQQLPAFYHIWTQKEAFIKASGEGFSFPTDQFAVSADPGLPGNILAIKGSRSEASLWQMDCALPAADLRAAVCVRKQRNTRFFWIIPELTDFITFVNSRKTIQLDPAGR